MSCLDGSCVSLNGFGRLRVHMMAFALLGVALVCSVGCGSGSEATPGPTPTPMPTPTPAPTPTPTPNPTPTVTAISPSSAPAGALAFMLMVHGSNFVPASTVDWNGSNRTTTFVSSTQLQAHIMAADLATPGKVSVTVVNPSPGGGPSSGITFTVAVDTIAFRSSRALDGTDAANSNDTRNIWVMNPDGSGPSPVTKLTVAFPFTEFPIPVWSPDGSKIAFASSRALNGSDSANANNTKNIWVVNPDGTGATALTDLTNADDSDAPNWSPDDRKIVFHSIRALDGRDAAGTFENIWVMDADGSNQVPLTKLTMASCFSPVWSPDGSKIAFLSSRALDGSDAGNTNATTNIWVMNPDGTGATPLTKLTAAAAESEDISWSLDGTKLAFDSPRAFDGSDATNSTQTFNIWVINVDGSNPVPLTKVDASNFGFSFLPIWSPDGSKVVYESARALDGSNAANTNHTQNVWVTNADGSGATPLTKLTALGSGSALPVWTPDGTNVLFGSGRALDGSDAINSPNGTGNIWVVNADGSGASPLTKLTALGAHSTTPRQP